MTLTGPTEKTEAWIKTTVERNPFRKHTSADGKDTGNWVTAPARLSFPHVFKAQAAMDDGGKDKFSATFLFPGTVDFEAFRKELNRVGAEKWGDQFAAYAKSESFHRPLKDQGTKLQYEGYVEGHSFFTASGERKPPVTNVRGTPVTDETKVYPGVWVIGIVRPYAFETRNKQGAVVKRGISVGLQALCVVADDKEFGGSGVDPTSAFAGVQIEGDTYDPDSAFSGAGASVSMADVL